MNATDRIAAVPEQDRLDDASSQPGEERMTAHRPATAKQERRFEFGFFIRKIVNGWVAFYRQFPREQRASIFRQVQGGHAAHGEPPVQGPAPGPGQAQTMALSHDDSGGDLTQKSGTGKIGGDTGPVGETSYELGVFFRTSTETSDESDDA